MQYCLVDIRELIDASPDSSIESSISVESDVE